MICPLCNKELTYHDYYGRLFSHQDGHREGDIFRCENEQCNGYWLYYHNHYSDEEELHEGMPC